LLAGKDIAKRWDIPVQQPMKLAGNLVFNRDVLFSAFRAAADGASLTELIDLKGNPVAVKVTIDDAGAAHINTDKLDMRFSHAVLMTSNREKRVAAAEEFLTKVVLTERDRSEVRQLAALETFSVDEFLQIAELAASSPDEFEERLREKANKRQVSNKDILPQDRRHWDHLTAPRGASDDLATFVAGELAQERRLRIARDPVATFPSIAFTFSAPSLVPHDLLASCSIDDKVRLLDVAAKLEDHFSLIGAFELCARWVGDDLRFAPIGERLLDALFADMKRLETACGLFAAAFILTVAQLSADEQTKTLPAYWRRLAAACHASLVVRACGVTEINHEELITWAMVQRGMEYFVSILMDFNTDPQWRPEWIDPRILLADVCGRALGAAWLVPKEKLPEGWKQRIDTLDAWVRSGHLLLLTMYPAVTEGARRPKIPILNEMGEISELYRKLIDDPSLDNLLMLRAPISTFGCPKEAVESLHNIIGQIRRSPAKPEDDATLDAFKLIAHVAVLLNDVALADAVADACLERLALADDRQTVTETVHRLIECSAADNNRENAKAALARRLEQLSFVLRNTKLLSEVIEYIEILKTTDPSLQTRTGRAIATAKLGRTKAA
jgi:hypothetical protein